MRDGRSGAPNGRPGPFRRADGIPADGGANGVPNDTVRSGGVFTRLLPDEDESTPVDLVAVQADDELVNALGVRPAAPAGERPPSYGRGDGGASGTDDRLMAMLAAWREEVDAEPIPELVDLDTAVAAVVAGVHADELARRRRHSGRLRQLAPLVAAAAIIVATVGGVGLGSRDAMPGDTLWAVQKVVNPERAESIETKLVVETRLVKVRTALQQGDTVTAAQELQAIRTEIPDVRDQEGQPQLVQEQEFLAAKLADTPPGTHADLSTPPKSNPAARPTATSSTPPPPATSEEPSATAPSGSASASEPPSTQPDPAKQRDTDKALVPVLPSGPDGSGRPAAPAPEIAKPQPETTTAPGATAPDPKPDPATEGGASDAPPASSASVPAPPPPASGDSGAAGDGTTTTTAGTTTASGSGDTSAQTTAPDTTTTS
jgi:hypothetical protein